MSLLKVISQLRSKSADREDWLLISCDAKDLTLDSDCVLSSIDYSEDDEEILPSKYLNRNFYSTIDMETVEDCITWADRLTGEQNDEAAAEVIRYYIRFDAWPERLGAADPPPANEILAQLDRDFYDALGPERDGTLCRRENCSRGTVQFSAFCAKHHFENSKSKPCPF